MSKKEIIDKDIEEQPRQIDTVFNDFRPEIQRTIMINPTEENRDRGNNRIALGLDTENTSLNKELL